MPPDLSEEYDSGLTYVWLFDPATSVGVGIGGGLVFFDKYNIGIRFYEFREVTTSGREKYGSTGWIRKCDQKVSMLFIALGIQF